MTPAVAIMIINALIDIGFRIADGVSVTPLTPEQERQQLDELKVRLAETAALVASWRPQLPA